MPRAITCTSLEEVRNNIDRLDTLMVYHLAERTEYVLQAARFKEAPGDIRVPSRIESIINRVRTLANKEGLDVDLVESIYRHIIEQSINREMIYWEKLNKNSCD